MSISMVNGAPTAWDCSKLSGVARSSTDAEYCGQSVAAVQQSVNLRHLEFLGIRSISHIQYVDSTAALQIAENPKRLGATRHLGVRWHFVRYQIFACKLTIAYSITEGTVADVNTKWLARRKLTRFATIFFNSLHPDWRRDYDVFRHISGPGVYPELDVDTEISSSESSLCHPDVLPDPQPTDISLSSLRYPSSLSSSSATVPFCQVGGL